MSEADSVIESHISAWNRFSIDAQSQSAAEHGEVWVDQTRGKGAAGVAYTGYDFAGVAHSRHRAPSTATTHSLADMTATQFQASAVSFTFVTYAYSKLI